MTHKKIHRDNEWRLSEQLKRLFMKKSFEKDLGEIRGMLGIPKNGFVSYKEYEEWLNNDLSKFMDIRTACVDESKKFKLPIHYSLFIEARLIMDTKFQQYNPDHPFDTYDRGFDKPDFICSWEEDSDYQNVTIKIFPGATARDVKRFIDQNFREMQKFLDTFERRVVSIRDSGKTKRNQQILQLRKKGLINAIGLPSSIEIREKIPEPLRNIKPDTKLSIIRKEKRMRR